MEGIPVNVHFDQDTFFSGFASVKALNEQESTANLK